MKQYKLTILITEGSDEFWESLKTTETTGCDEILEEVRSALDEAGINSKVALTSFTDD